MSEWWVSCNKFTVWVKLDDNHIIVDAAPIVCRFIGQPAANLKRWAQGLGGYKAHALRTTGT